MDARRRDSKVKFRQASLISYVTRPENQERYSLIEYTDLENAFKKRNICWCSKVVPILKIRPTTFTKAFQKLLLKSSIGIFLDQPYNPEVLSSKLEVAEYCDKHKLYPTPRNNDFCADPLALVRKALDEGQAPDLRYVKKNLQTLRMRDCMVTRTGPDVADLKRLQVLLLPGNWMNKVPGRYMPRDLRCLELFCNCIYDLRPLVRELPKTLLYLGLARNKLFSDSCLKVLEDCGMNHLKVLDLADNDICDLVEVLRALTTLPELRALSLEGNPCSTCVAYQPAVSHYLPKLVYLDATHIWPMDLKFPLEVLDRVSEAFLCITCRCLTGAPKPPKLPKKDAKRVLQCYQLEVDLPLLDPLLRELWTPQEEAEETEPETKEKRRSRSKEKKRDKKGKGSKNSKKSKGSKKSNRGKGSKGRKGAKEESWIEEETPGPRPRTTFATERRKWSSAIAFPPLHVPSPEGDLLSLRDTLRTKVMAKLIYQEILLPQKEGKKKSKKGKRGSKSKKKSKSSKGGKNKRESGSKKGKKKGSKGSKSADEEASEPQENPPEEEPKEEVLSRRLLARFSLQLQQCNWSEAGIPYSWTMGPSGERPEQAKRDDLPAEEEAVETERAGRKKSKGKNLKEGKNGSKKSKTKSKSSGRTKGSKKGSQKKGKGSKKDKKNKSKGKGVSCQLEVGPLRDPMPVSEVAWAPEPNLDLIKLHPPPDLPPSPQEPSPVDPYLETKASLATVHSRKSSGSKKKRKGKSKNPKRGGKSKKSKK